MRQMCLKHVALLKVRFLYNNHDDVYIVYPTNPVFGEDLSMLSPNLPSCLRLSSAR